MATMTDLHPQYITNEAGSRVSVVLPVDEFEALMEDVSDLMAVVARKNEPTISHQDLVAELKADGYLSD